MNFLAPLFLAGALAVALPVVFHLIRRTTRQRTVFSSLMFLKVTPPRLTRRNRLEDILLLLLRCAALCLLAIGFARPFIKHVMPENASAEPPKRIVVLVDTSASMSRANLWAQACDRAEDILRKTSPADRVALFTFDRQLTPLVTFDEWNSIAAGDRVALARGRLAGTKPGWSATRLDQAIIRASEMFAETDNGDATNPRQIVLISDFQAGSKLSALQGQEWPKGVEVVTERVAAKTSNAGLQLLADANDTPSSAGGNRVRVSNESDSKREQFQVGWARSDDGFVSKATEVHVPAGQSRIVTLPSPEKNSRADRITLRGDDEAFDDTVFSIPPETSRVSVIYIGSESETDSREPLYFLRRALQGSATQTIQVIAKQPTAPLLANEAEAATMFVVTDAMAEPLATALHGQIAQGKTLLFAPTSATAASTLGSLLAQSRLAVEEGAPGNYGILGEIDFRHPLFAPFADARYSDFTKIHFWKYRRLDVRTIPDARVVAKFDNGDAAIVEIPIGKGRVIFFASGWQPADSQLGLSTKFVPLLCSALELSGGAVAAGTQYYIGDTVTFPADWVQAANAAEVTLPNGSSLKLAAGESNFTQATMPGIYHVKVGTSEKQFAVNLDAAESRTAPLPLDELERLGAPVPKATAEVARATARKIVLQSGELESRQKLWRWFIAATLGVLLIETGMAGWTARRRMPKAEAAA